MTLDLTAIYKDLHSNPELSFQETRTAGIVAGHLRELGFEVTEGVGRTGVVGVLANGVGPTVLLRADMDGLPVEEQTGLDYASTARGTDPDGNDVPVMHACGHDVHVTCLLGAAELLAGFREEWSGTLVTVFQPAEEAGGGAAEMLRDGFLDRFPRPDVVLGQHVAPIPAGFIGLTPGPAMAAADSLSITLHGVGGHGSRPEATVDPVYLAANVINRLQGVVSREISALDTAVVTVGQVHAGTKNNIIPDKATLGLTVRSYREEVRSKVLESVERVAKAEAQASASPKEPTIEYFERFPVTVNDPTASERVATVLRGVLGEQRVLNPGPLSGSEDVGEFSTAADVPLVYWFLGGGEPSLAEIVAKTGRMPDDIPSNHSPFFAPVIDPTLDNGVKALVAAAREFLS
ncbi:amidohydrolase [Arthrobacter sp. Y-9]|uniref:amidohydrolase n=1 Tax=Arthrobacter sp. Y-9 TaxID=3039385 RepID=UPI00241F4ADD|nr:amidohydrolase [Arthrobacter sp. Y-9]WFR83977.1 amidohydrolase [Arthrobacter sp. Y-9]